MSDLVGTTEDRFSRVAAQIIIYLHDDRYRFAPFLFFICLFHQSLRVLRAPFLFSICLFHTVALLSNYAEKLHHTFFVSVLHFKNIPAVYIICHALLLFNLILKGLQIT